MRVFCLDGIGGGCLRQLDGGELRLDLEEELVHRHPWPNRQSVRTAIFEYIEGFYNTAEGIPHWDISAPLSTRKLE
jgi:hypothetical protein